MATRQTGITQFGLVLGAKRLELLHELVPKGVYIGVLVNPTNQDAETELKDLQEAAHLLGLMQASRCALPWPAASPSCDWRALHDRLLAGMRPPESSRKVKIRSSVPAAVVREHLSA